MKVPFQKPAPFMPFLKKGFRVEPLNREERRGFHPSRSPTPSANARSAGRSLSVPILLTRRPSPSYGMPNCRSLRAKAELTARCFPRAVIGHACLRIETQRVSHVRLVKIRNAGEVAARPAQCKPTTLSRSGEGVRGAIQPDIVQASTSADGLPSRAGGALRGARLSRIQSTCRPQARSASMGGETRLLLSLPSSLPTCLRTCSEASH